MRQLMHPCVTSALLLTSFLPKIRTRASVATRYNWEYQKEFDAVEKLNYRCAHGSAKANASEFNARAGGL